MKKCAFVSGADRGLGLELVRELLQKDYTVFAGRYLKEWDGLETLKQEFGDQLHLVEMDISMDESVKNGASYIKSKTDSLELLINNGAILGDIEATVYDELNMEEIQKVFNVNALGPLRVSNELASLIAKGETKLIVNISSEAGSIGTCWRDAWFGYCMSKAALNMESAIIHNSLRKAGGQVMVIHPGHMATYMRGEIDKSASITAEISARAIMERIAEHKSYEADKPAYIDYLGNKMEW